MNEDLFIKNGISIPASELSFSASRASGPGGQHVQKTSTRITLRWNIPTSTALSGIQKARVMRKLQPRLSGDGDLLIHVETTRSQYRNRMIARERLAELLAQALKVPKKRMPTRPSKAAKARRLDEKKKRSTTKERRKRPME